MGGMAFLLACAVTDDDGNDPEDRMVVCGYCERVECECELTVCNICEVWRACPERVEGTDICQLPGGQVGCRLPQDCGD